jgi:hypothetical protein
VVQQADRAHNLPHLPAHCLREVRGVTDNDGGLRYLRSREGEGQGGCERDEMGVDGRGWERGIGGGNTRNGRVNVQKSDMKMQMKPQFIRQCR